MPTRSGKFKAEAIEPPRPSAKFEFDDLPPEMRAMIGFHGVEGRYSHQTLSHLFGCSMNAIRRCVVMSLGASK